MYTAGAKYGMAPSSLPFTAQPLAVSNGAVTPGKSHKFWDPDSPELWLFGIGAVTLGLIAVSTSVKVGPLHFTGSI
jgi:hypothetical protein